jgi:hypothetical protein
VRLLGVAMAALAGAASAAPPDFSARYRVSMGTFTIGEARVVFERLADDRYRYSSLTRPTGVTGLFYRTEVAEFSEGHITAEGFRPDRYGYDRRGRGSRAAELAFNWDSQQVVNSVAQQRWQMPITADTMDRLVSQLQLMEDLGRSSTELEYRIADGGRLRTYQLKIEGEETIRTRFGEFDTIRVSRQHGDEADRATTFWAAPALNYLPVRIDHREQGDSFRMVLEAVEGLPAPASP